VSPPSLRDTRGADLSHAIRHGGAAVSEFLKHELHGIFESVHKDQIPETFAWAREIGGYFKRFDGGAMKPWLHGTEGTPEMDLAARATLTFFTVGRTAVNTKANS
jgi:protein phosphatase PTC6